MSTPTATIPIPNEIVAFCDNLSKIPYENLSKIVRFAEAGASGQAMDTDSAFLDDLANWKHGGTCFSLTWALFQHLTNSQMGLKPTLHMGHKRSERNVHCALVLPWGGTHWFFDPGYLIFDPLPLPTMGATLDFPLVPNQVRLMRMFDRLTLLTASAGQPFKERFFFDPEGVSISTFFEHWKQSFSFPMMHIPVLNRLDTALGVQTYYQKGNLMVRTAQGSSLHKIQDSERVALLARTFGLDESMVGQALEILSAADTE